MEPSPKIPATYFAPAERAGEAQLKELHQFVLNHPLFQAIIESIDGYLMILNPERQVLAMNPRCSSAGVETVGRADRERPGEVLDCIHAPEAPALRHHEGVLDLRRGAHAVPAAGRPSPQRRVQSCARTIPCYV